MPQLKQIEVLIIQTINYLLDFKENLQKNDKILKIFYHFIVNFLKFFKNLSIFFIIL